MLNNRLSQKVQTSLEGEEEDRRYVGRSTISPISPYSHKIENWDYARWYKDGGRVSYFRCT